jgi:hypothetical protein
MMYGTTAHNRSVYAPPSLAAQVEVLPALVFAAQSLYPGWQNVVNSWNIMYHSILDTYERIIYISLLGEKNEIPEDRSNITIGS